MMFGDRDYESTVVGAGDEKPRPQVAVMDCAEKDYSVVILRSRDRPKLLFDTVCTLTDMQYVVFHGTVDTRDDEAYQVGQDRTIAELSPCHLMDAKHR